MSTQAEIDLEARIGELERQLAELSAKVNPLYSGGMDRFIHSGYVQWDGIDIRLDDNGMQLGTDDNNTIGMRFVNKLLPDIPDTTGQSVIRGKVGAETANLYVGAWRANSQESATIVMDAQEFSAYIALQVYDPDAATALGTMQITKIGATGTYAFVSLTDTLLRITQLSADPSGADLTDGVLWYNTTDDKLRTVINSVTTDLGGGFSDAAISFTIDGGGAAIATGQKGHIEVPFNMTVTGWTIVADQSGSIVVDVWKDTYANFPPTVADTIAGSEKPTLSSAQKNQDLSLSSWATTLTKGDILAFNVDSASTVTRVTVSIRGTRT